MSKRTGKIRAFPATKGLDQSSMPGAQDPLSMWDCDNVIFTVNGSRKKFWGLNTYYKSGIRPDVTSNMRSMFAYWRNVASVQTQKVVVFAGGEFFADSADGAFSNITGSIDAEVDETISWDVFEGLIIGCMSETPPVTWNQTGDMEDFDDVCFAANAQHLPSYDVVTNPDPVFKHCRTHKQRLWLAGNPTAPHRLYYSSAGDPTDWRILAPGNAGSIDIDSGDSDPVGITAIFPGFHGDLYVAKRRSLYRIRELYSADLGTTTFSVDVVVKGVGCVEHNSAVATPNDILWASDRGIHSLSATDKYGDVEQSFLSFPIHESFRRDTNFFKSGNIQAVYDPDMSSYLVALTKNGSQTNDHLWCYNMTIGQWYQRKDFDCASICIYIDSRSKARTLVGREDINIGIFDEDIVMDLGEAKSMLIASPTVYPDGHPDMTWNFKSLTVLYRPQATGVIQIAYQVDNKGVTTEEIDMTWGDTTAQGAADLYEQGSLIGFFPIGSGTIGNQTVVQSDVESSSGGGYLKKSVVPIEGSGNGIRLAFYNPANEDNISEDCEIYGYIIEAEAAEDSNEATVS